MLCIGVASQGAVAGTVTVDAHDFKSGVALTKFTYIINEDNSKRPDDPLSLSTESHSPIVAVGDQANATKTLPDGRYLISVRALDHKMWGQHITLPQDNGTVRVDLTEQSAAHPLPLGKLKVFVFNDNAWTNGAPDAEEAGETGGLGGFTIELEEQTHSAVTVDYNNDPLCGGVCETESDGFVEIDNLGPATYFIKVTPPEGKCNSDPNSQWYQTTTIDGGLELLAPVEEGSDGTGAPGEQLWEPPDRRTAYWFGFVCAPMDFATPGAGQITGTARNWVEWAPYTTGTYNEPVQNPFVAVSDTTTNLTVAIFQGDGAGNFAIQNVPAGTYNLSIWDEQLSYIMRFKPVTVEAGQTVDVNDTGDDGVEGIGVSRWFGWLDGYVYKDKNGNGQFDPGTDTVIANTDVDQRWRDGSIKEGTFTDADGYYEYPTAEGGALGRWIVGEQGFARFQTYPGASVLDEITGAVIPSCVVEPPNLPADPCIPNSEGGGLLVNNLLLEGHRTTVDWGKRDYPAGTPGQIVGITYFATTRNEFAADKQAHEDYEPGIPDVTVYLEGPGPDGTPNTDDDVVLNQYVTDHWVQPNASQDPLDPANSFTQNCNPIRDYSGANIASQFNPKIGPNCLEVPLTGTQTKEGKFDGGYAFADYCPESIGGFVESTGLCADGSDLVPLVAGNYIVHAIMPKDPTDGRDCNPGGSSQRVTDPKGTIIPGGGKGCLYHIVREEDVNVDLGNQFGPQIPPPPCNGDKHTIDQSTLTPRSVYSTANPTFNGITQTPLCDKHLVELKNQQNANADFYLMTNFPTDPNGDGASTAVGDVAVPGRVIGQVFNDIYFERNQGSPWYGEPRPIAGIPVGIYARVDTVPNVNQPYDPNNWRLIKTLTTSADGAYEILLPSTETFNCPIPQGPCPGMYIAIVDDPGSKAHPNPGYDPNLLTANTPFEVWPGLTTQLDTPLDPISGTGCDFSIGPGGVASTVPELLQVSRPYVLATDSGTGRRITIQADFIGPAGPTGATGGRVTLTDVRSGNIFTLTRANGGIVSWTPGSGSTPDTIVIQVPAINTLADTNPLSFRPGPKQLAIIGANSNGGRSSVNGITVHVLGTNGSNSNTRTYTPSVVLVLAPTLNGHQLQTAIDNATAGSLLVLKAGTYNENVLLWKPLKLQGLGPGGIIGAHELNARAPEDARFHVVGSVIDGRFFAENATAYNATITGNSPYAGVSGNGLLPPNPVLRGADITVVAKTQTAYDLTSGAAGGIFSAARIDGLGLMTGRGDGAGGIQLQAHINNMQLTNNILENNGGIFAGGIGLGQPYPATTSATGQNHNWNVRIANDRILGNGGLTRSGGLGIFYGSNNYEVARSILCSNFGVEYGAGISHWGLSPRSSIHDNQIYYNDAVDSGAGIAIQSEIPVDRNCDPNTGTVATCLGDGSGSVDVDRNLIQSNFSGDDGGGIFVEDAFAAQINIRNNMIVNNGAAHLGGAITLDDTMSAAIINNTIANNVSTASSESSAPNEPHAAGLVAQANNPLLSDILAQRTEMATRSNNSTLVLDNSITVTDLGKKVSGTGMPSGATIVAVNPGVSFTLSAAATGNGTAIVTLSVAGVSANGLTPNFSNPVALFNNIFWNNEAFTLDQFGPGATLASQGIIDFEIFGAPPTGTFTPRYSYLTNGQVLGSTPVPANQGNTINAADPGFVAPFTLELTVSGSRLDPQQAAVTITGQDPPVGLTGDYHISLPTALAARLVAAFASQVIDRGVRCSNTPFPGPSTGACTGGGIEAPIGISGADFDNQARPIPMTIRLSTPWDRGADESTVLP